MKLNCIAIAILLLPSHLSAQSVQYLVPPNNNYSSISSFSEGMAKIEFYSDSIGYLDAHGKLLFSGKYNEAGNFHCNRAFVSKRIKGNEKFGFIDKKGKLIIPCIYDQVQDFSCNRALVRKNGKWQVIDMNGKTVMNDSFLITKTKVADISAKKQHWEDSDPPSFCNGLMRIKIGDRFGFTDTTGKIVIPAKFRYAKDFSDGVALVETDEIKVDSFDLYLKNDTGVLGKIYNRLPEESPKYITAWIDTAGKLLFTLKQIPDAYAAGDFHNGMLLFCNYDNQWGFMNKKLKVLIAPTFYNKPFEFSDNVTAVQIDGKDEGNKDGYILIMDTSGKTLAKVPLCNSGGCIDDSHRIFCEGLLAVRVNGDWGYMDKSGRIIIAPQFDTALDFSEGAAVVVTKDGKVAVIKNPLKEIIE